MMTLDQVARVFDKDTFQDAYTTATFVGQVLPFPDSVMSGVATRRRILDVSDDVTIPTTRTIFATSSSQYYVLAAPNHDYFKGQVIRTKYPMHAVDSTYYIRTVGQLLAASGGTSGVYMSPIPVRARPLPDSSILMSSFEFYFSSYYDIAANTIIYDASNYYRVKLNSKLDGAGFGVVEAVEIMSPVSTVTVTREATVYDPTTDSYPDLADITGVSVFSEPLYVNFTHDALGFVGIQEGDRAISMLKSQVPAIAVGHNVGDYKVKAVADEGDAWTVHGRPF